MDSAAEGKRTGRDYAACGSCAAAQRSMWCGIDELCLDRLKSARTAISYSAGRCVFVQGDTNAGIYCIGSGTVAIRRLNASGDSVLLKLGYPGDIIGYRSFLAGATHRTSAEAIGPVTVCRIDRRALTNALATCPTLSAGFLDHAIADVDSAHDTLMRQATLSNRARLCQVLIDFSRRHGLTGKDGGRTITLPISRRDLASMIGARHETLSRIMSRLEKDGIAHFSGRTVVIPRLDRLTEEMRLACGS